MARNVGEYVAASSRPELKEVFEGIAAAAVQICAKIRLAGLADVYGAAGATNVQGEQQQKLDVFANDVMMETLGKLPSVAACVSEEDEEPVVYDKPAARYAVIFDPLDGSSNIDVNVNVGTIVSVQQSSGDAVAAALQPGSAQVGACYVVYGPSCVMVVSVGDGVAAFTLDDTGVFLESMERMTMPAQGPYYSTNEANGASWPQAYRDYLKMLQSGGLNAKSYGARYIGSLVADFHRTMLKGGVFWYAPTEKAPNGKLRLLYEANPLAMIAEQAGGAATNGATRILDLKPEKVHQRTPLVIGSRVEVEALQKAVAEAK